MIKVDKLNILTAGMPLSTPKNGGYSAAFQILEQMGLDGLEVEFVHGVRMSDDTKKFLKQISKEKGFLLTSHGPFYINLNSKEKEKVKASVKRIVETAQAAQDFGGYSITYHAAFYMGRDKEVVYNQVKTQTQKIVEELEKNNIKNVWIRPETTGKSTQWGDYEEIIRLSKEFEQVLPCVDFSHVHARTGGAYNTYDEFCKILDRISTELGQKAIDNFHAHIAGIEYTSKGEKRHLIFEQADMNYKDLLKAMKSFGVKGALVCESPNIEIDAKILKDYYVSL
ncbi:TIM barrel protein [bacterium]|nr:TIM barrel protein [bacterium]